MDFVNTLRFWEDMRECHNSITKEEKREFLEGSRNPDLLSDYSSDKNGFHIPPDLLKIIEKEVTFTKRL